MSVIDLVGRESLPNLYFDRIELSMATPSSTFLSDHRLKLTFSCYDSKERSWRGRPELQDMKIKIVSIHDHDNGDYEFNKDVLDSGNASLYSFKADTDEYKVKIIPVASNISEEEQEYDKFIIGTTIEIPALQSPLLDQEKIITSNLTIYAAFFIDSLDFGNEIFNKFYGPASAEVILKNAHPNTTSKYFYFPDTNEEYGGPVHLFEDTWMAGPFHTDQPHRKLRMVTVPNYKLEVEEL